VAATVGFAAVQDWTAFVLCASGAIACTTIWMQLTSAPNDPLP
jgi:hypothetical protein